MKRGLRKLQAQMIECVYGSKPKVVVTLLDLGVPVNEPFDGSRTLLYLAAVQGETEIVRVFLEHGADPNVESRGESEGTPLCAASCWGHTEIVKLLLDHGADPNQVEGKDIDGGMTALEWARHTHHDETAQVLIEHGAKDRERPL